MARGTIKERVTRFAALAVGFFVAATVAAQAQSFTPFYDFPTGGGDGNQPYQMTMILATDGNYYGVTRLGGVQEGCCGTVFRLSPSGSLTSLYAFCQQANCADGSSPYGGVVEASDGNFYGTTYSGGANNAGTIFRITPKGKFTKLYDFCWYPNSCSPYSGGAPMGALMQASNGDLYGTTYAGTAFKISLKGKFKLLYTFPVSGSVGALIEVGKTLYGTTETGGANDLGSIFKMSLGGKVTTLYSFGSQPNCADGQEPLAGLVKGPKGYLYGTTYVGGSQCGGFGTAFKISTKGAFTSLAVFQEGAGPSNPAAPLMLSSDGTLYGTSTNGGANPNATNPGTVFQIANDTLAAVFPLTGGCVGVGPWGGLVEGANGSLYGTSPGTFGCGDGAIFQFTNANDKRASVTH
jgi:uncharacterized repeat protein (TIGR03803 family)